MTSRLEKGASAPKVTLNTIPEGEVTLGEGARGQVVFFYPKDNTPGCTNEAKDFSAAKAEFDALGFDIIGVSKDSLKKHENFIAKQELSVTLASDIEGTACEAYGVWVEKAMYGKKYMGIERSTFLISAGGKVLEVWQKVKVKGHALEVLAEAQKARRI